jgi:hypothetical protein
MMTTEINASPVAIGIDTAPVVISIAGRSCGNSRSQRIRDLNDAFRAGRAAGKTFFSPAVAELGREITSSALAAVRAFSTFSADDDPYGEHDCGAFRIGDEKLCWKIDYYDPSLDFGSKDPADPAQTARVLTIMLADEW